MITFVSREKERQAKKNPKDKTYHLSQRRM